MGLSRILVFSFCIILSKVLAGEFFQNNHQTLQNYGIDTISFESFVNRGKFPTSGHTFEANNTPNLRRQSVTLFKAADYADSVAYEEEVENAHRVALINRRNNTDAGYIEAYNEALQAQRKYGTTNSYISHLLQHQLGSQSSLASQVNRNYQNHRYEDVSKEDRYSTDYNLDLSHRVEHVATPNIGFSVNDVRYNWQP